MKSFRLALPAAVLAAVVGVTSANALDIATPTQFMLEESNRAEQQSENRVENAPTRDTDQPQNASSENPWKGLTFASIAPAASVLRVAPAGSQLSTSNPQIVALVDKHASAHGLPLPFARAVVRIESNFNPRATGSQREVGLMQIKYETARGIGFTGTREELYEPNTNLKWGMKYLAMAWKLGGATPCGAVLRYQAGHAATQPTSASRVYCSKVQQHMASAN